MSEFVADLKKRTFMAKQDRSNREEKRLLEENEKFICEAIAISNQIPHKCREAADNGESFVVVMELEYDDYEGSAPNNKLSYDKLIGSAAIVWNRCIMAKLNPSIEFWHDGGGIESGFNIVAHWE